MTKWLQSGRRRDICFILAATGPLRGQELKSRLEDHYDERLEPRSFYGSLSSLVDQGFVETRTEGVHDVYSLTETGTKRTREHGAWVATCLE